MTTDIYTDLTARDRCTALAAQESLSEADVYSIAIGVGLNVYHDTTNARIFGDGAAPPYRALVLSDWTPTSDATAQLTAVTVSTDDATRVMEIADDWTVSEDVVRSKALCTGLAMLSGIEAYVGPWEP